ncbi:MAG: carboxypeptidase regulatory-like domain-containing protein [Bacteroidetes bacterium]|nr:carboxypeptidase regulatory-like domain-containing protein [Bacteroidota bacterium]
MKKLPLSNLQRLLPLLMLCALVSTTRLHAKANLLPDTLLGDAEYYLELRGKIMEWKGEQRDDEKQVLDSAVVQVINQQNKVCIEGFSDSKGRLAFKLPLGRSFTISISKPGYVKKLIRVETYVPAEDRKVFTFTFNIDIFEKIEKLDVSVLSKPISRIRYRPLSKDFDYDKEYTAKVNGDLQKMYNEYYALRRAEERRQTAEREAARRDSLRAAAKAGSDSVPAKKQTPPPPAATPRLQSILHNRMHNSQ